MLWEIKEQDIDNGKIITPVGEIDMKSSVDLREILQKLVREKTAALIVDLQEITHIDSSGLATLIECLQEINKYNGCFKLIINNPKIIDVFKLAKLDYVFRIYSDRHQASQND